MEFHEKLQELRKSRKLTQEELAEALYVSRTAISKWESGRGYPSIDSLKEISLYFSVTIDELLSSEKLLSIAEKENKANIRNMCDLLFGIVDIFTIILIILPLYPNTVETFIYSVNLFQYMEISNFHRSVYWLFFLALVITGIAKILLPKEGNKNQILTAISMTLSILIILFLALAREAYAIAVTFLLFVIKIILLLKYMRT
ncbi:MAG: helix-turn-helix transcriptional regulator [Anaerotignum sp.]|nr:helix-turn-helix transcriptional regulator [Anaerotignum sp.]